MKQKILARLHRVLIIAKLRQGVVDKILQGLQRLGAGHRPAKARQIAKVA